MCHRSNSDYCMTILLRQPWEELVPWEPTPWHWSKHVKFRSSWLFHKGCLSLHSWQTAMLHMLAHWTQHTGPSQTTFIRAKLQLFYQVLSFENNPWAGLGRILAVACATKEKHWCPTSTFSYFHRKGFLGKPATITFGENKDVNSSIKFRL